MKTKITYPFSRTKLNQVTKNRKTLITMKNLIINHSENNIRHVRKLEIKSREKHGRLRLENPRK